MGKTRLRLATYNIHGCIGSDGRYDPERILAVIKQLDADVIALQEVVSLYKNDVNLLDSLGDRLGMHIIPGLTMFRESSSYGNAVLSRWKMDRVSQINISFQNLEPRGAISMTTKIGTNRVHIIATHLGLSRSERQAQTHALLQKFQKHPADIHVLMGDLNEWYPWSNRLRQLRKHFFKTASPATFPAGFPILALDRILVQPSAYQQNPEPIKNSLTRSASDHLPLQTTLMI